MCSRVNIKLTQSKEQIPHCLLVSLSSLVMPSQEGSMDCRIGSHHKSLEHVNYLDDVQSANNLWRKFVKFSINQCFASDLLCFET